MATYSKRTIKHLYGWFIHNLHAVPKSRGWINCNCPFCGAVGKFGVKPLTGNTHCFRCGYDKPPIQAIMELTNSETEKKAWEQVFSGDWDFLDVKVPESELKINNKVKGLELPEGYHNIIFGTNHIAKVCRQYLKNRGFSIAALSQKGFGYCDTGPYKGYVIIPYIMHDQLVYFNARKVMGAGTTKYKNPVANETGLGKAYVIYNIEALYLYKRVQLCEGAFNAETIGDSAIATAGKLLTEWQINTILSSPVEAIDLLLDPDALVESVNLALKLVNFKKVRVVYWEDKKSNGTYLDVNDLGKKETIRRIRKHKFLTYGELINYKMAINHGRKYSILKK